MKAKELIQQLELNVEALTDITLEQFYTLSDNDLNWKQSAEKWSVLECFEHLNRYSRYYLPEIERALQRGTKAGVNDQYTSTWLGSYSIKMMDPSNRKKQKTFNRMNPVNSALNRNVLDEFLKHQYNLQELLDKAKEVNINTARVRIEFFKILTITAGEALQFVIVHAQRHILQAQDLRCELIKKEPELIQAQ